VFFIRAGHPGLRDHEREVGGIEVAADIADEGRQVGRVLRVEAVVDPVVPALVPGEARQHRGPAVAVGNEPSRRELGAGPLHER
jgi:hypothetical protein